METDIIEEIQKNMAKLEELRMKMGYVLREISYVAKRK